VTGRKLDRAIIGILVLALAWFAWDKFGKESEPFSQANVGSEQDLVDEKRVRTPAKSIAVLPFVNMSGEADNEYFSDGISEEILNALAKVDDLKVAGRTSSFAFKGQNQDLRQIGEALGVNHILEGSVRKAGNMVRITAQLIQVEDGFHMWSETYDRELIDVFAIQDEIAAAILEELKAELLAGEIKALMAAETDPEVYELYLRAKQQIYARTRESIESAAEMLDTALEIDPNYAPALAQRGMATLLLQQRNYGALTAEQAEPVAKSFFDRALAADPDSAEAWAGLGLYHTNRAREIQAGIEALEKALSINPNLIDASNWLQIAYGSIGAARKSLGILEDMFERDPLYPPLLSNLVVRYGRFGEFDKAKAVIERVEPYFPGDSNVLDARAIIHTQHGDCASALPLLEASLERDPDSGTTMFGYGHCLMRTHQYEELLSHLVPPWQRIHVMHTVGRTEEATLLAYEQAATGEIDSLIQLMNRSGRPADVVRFFDERWASIEQFDSEYPGDSIGNQPLLEMAYAFQRTGDEQRFEQAMEQVRTDHDALHEQGIKVFRFSWLEAIYYALAGDRDKALDYIEQAVARGGITTGRMAWEYPAFAPLEGDPRYEAIQQKMIDNLNRQRAELGLEPVKT
jgi:TolB-like protein/Tfp pilus assembly protein PilF